MRRKFRERLALLIAPWLAPVPVTATAGSSYTVTTSWPNAVVGQPVYYVNGKPYPYGTTC